MKNPQDMFGIAIAIGFVVAFVAYVATVPTMESSIQPQGEMLMEKTVSQLEEIIPEKEDISEVMKKAEQVVESIPKAAEEVMEEIEQVVPSTPPIIEKSLGEQPLLAEVRIPSGTSVPGCEENNMCFLPATVIVGVNGEVIWSNVDSAAHTVTSGSPVDGPDGIFDSSLLMSGNDFSHKFTTKGEYDYFCIVHPWMIGTVKVQ